MKSFQMLAEIRLAGLQIADCADDDGVLLSHVQNPLIVFQPRACFYLDCSDNPQRCCNPSIAAR